MSLNASNWVWDLKLGDATRKLVLLRFADHAHDDGTAAWCGVPKVADFAECSTRTVRRHIAHLVEHGYMREGDQDHVKHYPANKRPIVYDLAMDEATRAAWELHNAAGGNTLRESASASGKVGAERKAANLQVNGPDKLAGQEFPSSPTVGPDTMSGPVGPDTEGRSGLTDAAVGPDTGVTQTTLETTPGTTQTTSEPLRDPADAKSKIVLTEQETATGRSPDGQPLKGQRADALAHQIATAWWEWCTAEEHSHPASGFPACRAVIATAIRAGVHPKDLRNALAKLSVEGHPVSGNTLQIALRDLKAGSTQQGLRRGRYDDVATWGERKNPSEVTPVTSEEAAMIFGKRDPRPGQEDTAG